MNNKGKGSVKSYISVFIVMIIALVAVFGMLELAKIEKKGKPLVDNNTTTTTTSSLINGENISNNSSGNNSNEPIINFSEPLLSIISKSSFFGDYTVETTFNGINFNFNCTSYDHITETCLSGSGLMNINNVLIPLYTYSNENENFINRPKDMYIIVTDFYIAIIKNNVGFSAGQAKIYDKNGFLIGNVENVITGYKKNDQIISMLYPNITDNTFNYYMCDNNVVKISSIDISNGDNINNVVVDEIVDGVSCY